MKPDREYLERSLRRIAEAAEHDAHLVTEQVMREASAAGALQGGRTLLMINERVLTHYRDAVSKMAGQLGHSAGGAFTEGASLLDTASGRLGEALSVLVRDLHTGPLSFDANLSPRLIRELGVRLREIREAVVDDFAHGMLNGVRLMPDPLVSIISNITNSPGAAAQTGIGNFSHEIFQQQFEPLLKALDEFERADQVQKLSEEQKVAVKDLVDVIRDQVKTGSPDPGKIKRWGARLLELATDFGVQAAAGTLAAVLAKMFGVI